MEQRRRKALPALAWKSQVGLRPVPRSEENGKTLKCCGELRRAPTAHTSWKTLGAEKRLLSFEREESSETACTGAHCKRRRCETDGEVSQSRGFFCQSSDEACRDMPWIIPTIENRQELIPGRPLCCDAPRDHRRSHRFVLCSAVT